MNRSVNYNQLHYAEGMFRYIVLRFTRKEFVRNLSYKLHGSGDLEDITVCSEREKQKPMRKFSHLETGPDN